MISPSIQFAIILGESNNLIQSSKKFDVAALSTSAFESYSDNSYTSINRCFLLSGSSGTDFFSCSINSSETMTGSKSGQGKYL